MGTRLTQRNPYEAYRHRLEILTAVHLNPTSPSSSPKSTVVIFPGGWQASTPPSWSEAVWQLGPAPGRRSARQPDGTWDFKFYSSGLVTRNLYIGNHLRPGQPENFRGAKISKGDIVEDSFSSSSQYNSSLLIIQQQSTQAMQAVYYQGQPHIFYDSSHHLNSLPVLCGSQYNLLYNHVQFIVFNRMDEHNCKNKSNFISSWTSWTSPRVDLPAHINTTHKSHQIKQSCIGHLGVATATPADCLPLYNVFSILYFCN